MTDYTELIRSLRNCSNNRCTPCDCGWFDKYQVDESCKEIIMWKAAAAIEALQAQLPKRGKWIWIQKANGGQYKGCSVCHAPIPTDSMLDYLDDEDCDFCYSCGAKMEVQE